MSLLDLEWWVYLFIVLTFFMICLGLNYVVKKINETKIDERFIRMLNKASTTQSTQVTGPLIVMETARAAQSNIKTPQPSPKGISLVFNREENKRQKDLQDTMNIIKATMFQKKFDSLSLNTNASLDRIDAIPLVRNSRTVNDAIHLKASETARNAANKETHDTKSNLMVTDRVLIKRNEYGPGTNIKHSASDDSDCYITDIVDIEKNQYGHVAARPTTSVNQSNSNVCDLLYMGDDGRIADTGTKVPFISNGNPVIDKTVSIRVQQEDQHNEKNLPHTTHSFNENQSTSYKKESDQKISRKSFPNIFKKYSNIKKVEDSVLPKIVHNIVSKISSTLSKHANDDTSDNTLKIKAKEVSLDKTSTASSNTPANCFVESNAIAKREIQSDQCNDSRRLSSTAWADSCLTEVISKKQNELLSGVTKESSNIQSDQSKTNSKIGSIRKSESAKAACPSQTLIGKETSESQKNRSLTVVISMKKKELKNKVDKELLNTSETAQIKLKSTEDNQPDHIIIKEICDTKNYLNITIPETNKKTESKKSSIKERSIAQTNLITPETIVNNESRPKPVREISNPTTRVEVVKQSRVEDITANKLQTIEKREGDQFVASEISNIRSVPNAFDSKTATMKLNNSNRHETDNKKNSSLIKSCFENTDPKKSSIMERAVAQTNLIIPEAIKNYEIEHKPARENSNPKIDGDSKARVEVVKQSIVEDITSQKLQSIGKRKNDKIIAAEVSNTQRDQNPSKSETATIRVNSICRHETDNKNRSYIQSEIAANNTSLIKTCFENTAPKKSSIMERAVAQTNLIIPETTENNESKHSTVRETSNPVFEESSKARVEVENQPGLEDITAKKVQAIEKQENQIIAKETSNIQREQNASRSEIHETDNNPEMTTNNTSLIKSCFEPKLETVDTKQSAHENISSQSHRSETREVVSKEQSVQKVTESKVFLDNDSKRSLSKDSSHYRNFMNETINAICTRNITESMIKNIEHNIVDVDETDHEKDTNGNLNTVGNVTKSDSIKVTESVPITDQTGSSLFDNNEEQEPVIPNETFYTHSDRSVIQFRLDNMNNLLFMPHSNKDDDSSGNYFARAVSDKMCESEPSEFKYSFRSDSDFKKINDYKHPLPTKFPFSQQSETVEIELPCAISDCNVNEYISNETDASTNVTENASKIIKQEKEITESSYTFENCEAGPSQATVVSEIESSLKERIKALLLMHFINEDNMILWPKKKK